MTASLTILHFFASKAMLSYTVFVFEHVLRDVSRVVCIYFSIVIHTFLRWSTMARCRMITTATARTRSWPAASQALETTSKRPMLPFATKTTN